MEKKTLTLTLFLFAAFNLFSQKTPLIANIYNRTNITLNGQWEYIIDPLENGYYSYRMQEKSDGFFLNQKAKNSSDLVEYNFSTSPIMNIPGDWNTQDNQLFFYEGTVWLKKDFSLKKQEDKKYILYFGAANYWTVVYVNGRKVGEHVGGYTPFNFDVTNVVKDGKNFVVVKADNTRHKDNVPTVNMDWWNYGGITHDVMLTELSKTYIEDYLVQWDKNKKGFITGFVKLNDSVSNKSISLEIPELKINKQLTTDENGTARFELKANPTLWTPENPKLYDIFISDNNEKINDQIGFRTIETQGKKLLLNGKQVFLRGISIHEEAPFSSGRAYSEAQDLSLLNWAKELGCNFVRLAHYPHNEKMVRLAEKLGLMVWSEIPVYWTISWENPATYQNAQNQLHDMIYRDKNRCAIIIWSIANETPHGAARELFLGNLSKYARQMDNTRLISMAMETNTNYGNKTITVKDDMNKYVDVISFNEYMGWYWGDFHDWSSANWDISYDKPVIISEFGGGALQGLHGGENERWTEEYQAALYKANLQMLENIDGLSGMSPWILVDFRSPRRQLSRIQDFYNRKGIISNKGDKKKAFFVLQDYYKKKKEKEKEKSILENKLKKF